MTISGREMRNSPILANDGEIGHVEDIFFDDSTWRVRYLVIDTRNWLPGRKVLISPEVVAPRSADEGVRVMLTREQIRHSPDVSTDPPVSRRALADLTAYYAWSPAPMGWMPAAGLPAVGPAPIDSAGPEPPPDEGDPHLRSMNEVIGYSVDRAGETVGRIDDLAISVETPVVDHLVIRSDGGDALAAPAREIGGIDFNRRLVRWR